MNRLLLVILVLSALTARAETQWIWLQKSSKDGEKVSFRTSLDAPADLDSAQLRFTCDNGATLLVNDQVAGENRDWQFPVSVDVKSLLKPGQPNQLLVHARNKGGSAALVVELTLKSKHGETLIIATHAQSWEASRTGSDDWKPAVEIAKYGSGPWGKALEGRAGKGSKKTAPEVVLRAEDISCPPGFKIEHLYTVPKDSEGSWVALTSDPRGRVLACDQYGGLYRITPPPMGTDQTAKVEKLTVNIDGGHGLLYAFDSLYFMRNEGPGDHGLFRLRDTDGDDQFDEVKLLRKLAGAGEHGCHSIVLAPDGQSLFIVAGNQTALPDPLEKSRAARVWGEDHVIERMWDANGHARGRMAPGGYICKTDPDGKSWELFSYGFRNQFDAAFNEHGELFTYDADMEWDIGSPWYRPTRINHCISGADFGWRSGSGKWPEYYPDSLPSTLDIGPGSPTGVVSGMGAKFPAKYQRAIFANDWTYGTMYAVHLTPRGASYEATKEEFIFGKPLPLTDVIINATDGAMYFAVGGRRTQSALYRCVYIGDEATAKVEAAELPQEFQQRRELEALHQEGGAEGAVAKAVAALDHPDRHVRYAARVVLEQTPVSQWLNDAWNLTGPDAIVESAVAIARTHKGADVEELLLHLAKLASHTLTIDQQLAALRALQLIIIRVGAPEGDALIQTLDVLEPMFPSKHPMLDRELCATLVALGSTAVVSKAVHLMATVGDAHEEIAETRLLDRNDRYSKAAEAMQASRPNRQQMWFAFCLREATAGWTPDLWRSYFSWFPRTGQWKGGNSFRGFLNNIRAEALMQVSDDSLRKELDEMSAKLELPAVADLVMPKGPGRGWTVDEVLALTSGGLAGRNFQQGKNMYAATMCLTCHRFNGDGGSIGPDLTGAGNRYTMRDFLENIVDPSKVISDQYESHQVIKTDGSVVIGRIMEEGDESIKVASNPFAPQVLTTVAVSEIASRKVYPVSLMPAGLINSLNQDELLDLIAYTLSGGNADDKAFQK
jgi:putative heme-binding domain-containing protein